MQVINEVNWTSQRDRIKNNEELLHGDDLMSFKLKYGEGEKIEVKIRYAFADTNFGIQMKQNICFLKIHSKISNFKFWGFHQDCYF